MVDVEAIDIHGNTDAKCDDDDDDVVDDGDDDVGVDVDDDPIPNRKRSDQIHKLLASPV